MLDISIKLDTTETLMHIHTHHRGIKGQQRCHKCCEKVVDESVHVHTLTMSNENLRTWAIVGLSKISESAAVHAVPDRGYLSLRAL